MNFCCGVTLYYPSRKELESIQNYIKAFDCVYIYDNTDNIQQAKENKEFFSLKSGFKYISNLINDGLSVAYNIMCQRAISEQYQFICLFDQDSIISIDDIRKMVDYIESDINAHTVAVYAPLINYKQTTQYRIKENNHQHQNAVEKSWVISSGSFINLSIFQQTEGFDEEYFIDRIDFDYCLMVRKLGYKVIQIQNVCLQQQLGKRRKKLLQNWQEHDSIRHYYIFRNRLYFYLKKYKEKSIVSIIIMSFLHILRIVLFESSKFKKIRMVAKGWMDFRKGKMGKFINENS